MRIWVHASFSFNRFLNLHLRWRLRMLVAQLVVQLVVKLFALVLTLCFWAALTVILLRPLCRVTTLTPPLRFWITCEGWTTSDFFNSNKVVPSQVAQTFSDSFTRFCRLCVRVVPQLLLSTSSVEYLFVCYSSPDDDVEGYKVGLDLVVVVH